MPTYDYECTSCGHAFEAFQSMSEEPLSECPECGKAVRRLIGGGVGIIFKGSGFYATDSKSGGKRTGGSASQSTESGDGGSEKSDSKSEKSDTKSDASEGKKDSKSDSKGDSKKDPKKDSKKSA